VLARNWQVGSSHAVLSLQLYTTKQNKTHSLSTHDEIGFVYMFVE